MSKDLLIERISSELEITKTQAGDFIKSFVRNVKELVLEDDCVIRFKGFGQFKKHVRVAHDGINPKTGEKIKIPEKVSFKFKVSSGA